jgi:hypothetical protein
VNERIGWILASAIILIQAVMLGYGLTRASSPQRLETPISPGTELDLPLDLEGVLPFAAEQASRWDESATLVRASMQIDWPNQVEAESGALPIGGWIVLSWLGSNELLTMRLDRGSGTIVETLIVDVSEDSRDAFAESALDLSFASTRSGTAIRAADEAYGRDYRSMCPDQRFTSWLTVMRDVAGGASSWHIEFEDHSKEKPAPLRLEVDWDSGDIRNVKNERAACS